LIFNSLTAQLSLEPLLISAALTVAWPVPSSALLTVWQTALGLASSLIVTVVVQVAILSAASLTRSVTVLAPFSEQSKLTESANVVPSLLSFSSLTAQLSLDPLLISAALSVAWPVVLRETLFGL